MSEPKVVWHTNARPYRYRIECKISNGWESFGYTRGLTSAKFWGWVESWRYEVRIVDLKIEEN